MEKITEDQIIRQDFVDNQIYDLVKRINPSRSEIEWNIEMIADIRDTIQHWLVDQYKIADELEFYP
jgi:DNA polymerase sigma